MSKNKPSQEFRPVTIQGKIRRNGKYMQLVWVDASGKERYFILQEVPSLRLVYEDKKIPFQEPGQ